MDIPTDLNNNSSEEKSYSLRPRSSIKNSRECDPEDEVWKPRGRPKRRSKQKSAPLSKYRRKTANARERSRMREINEAFEALRRAVPHLNSNSENPQEKISKIMTLKLAMKYITALSNALQEPNFGESSATLSDIILSFDDNITLGSISENSELGDDFFSSTLQSKPLSSTILPHYDVPGMITPPLSESAHLPPFNLLRPDPLMTENSSCTFGSSSTLLQTLASASSEIRKPARTFTRIQNPSFFITPSDLRSHTLTPPEEISRCFPNSPFKENFLPASTFTTSSTFLSTDFDGLPSPSMDLEDLLIK